MTENHPITPSTRLIAKWAGSLCGFYDAARWGADQELEACCADIHTVYGQKQADWLRSMRRPRPPSLAEQGLKALDSFESFTGSLTEVATIRTALERLQELENCQ